jgi:hypothetical protein
MRISHSIEYKCYQTYQTAAKECCFFSTFSLPFSVSDNLFPGKWCSCLKCTSFKYLRHPNSANKVETWSQTKIKKEENVKYPKLIIINDEWVEHA